MSFTRRDLLKTTAGIGAASIHGASRQHRPLAPNCTCATRALPTRIAAAGTELERLVAAVDRDASAVTLDVAGVLRKSSNITPEVSKWTIEPWL